MGNVFEASDSVLCILKKKKKKKKKKDLLVKLVILFSYASTAFYVVNFCSYTHTNFQIQFVNAVSSHSVATSDLCRSHAH